jgi:hypothetical protein
MLSPQLLELLRLWWREGCGFRHHRDHDSAMMAISVPT